VKEKDGDEDDEDEYGGEYYDEEEPEDGDSSDHSIKGDDIDAKLKQKYIFLFKAREDMKPDERRWKWVR